MALNIFFVRADTIDGENQDLLVRAAEKNDCEEIWRKHYELEATDTPEWVGQVPGAIATEDTPGAIDWGLIH